MSFEALFKEVELGRNDKCIFYRTSFTVSATKWASDKWNLKNIVAVLATDIMPSDLCYNLFDVEKIGPNKSYLIIDIEKNEYLYETKIYEDLLFHIDMLGISKKFDDSE